MASSEEAFAISDLCRMCLDDLSSLQEYYFIDGELIELIETLTTISVCLFLFFSKL